LAPSARSGRRAVPAGRAGSRPPSTPGACRRPAASAARPSGLTRPYRTGGSERAEPDLDAGVGRVAPPRAVGQGVPTLQDRLVDADMKQGPGRLVVDPEQVVPAAGAVGLEPECRRHAVGPDPLENGTDRKSV